SCLWRFRHSCGASTSTASGSMRVALSSAWKELSTIIQKEVSGSGRRLLNTRRLGNNLAPEFSPSGIVLTPNRNIRQAMRWTSSTTRETHRTLCSIVGAHTSSVRSYSAAGLASSSWTGFIMRDDTADPLAHLHVLFLSC